VNQRPAAAEGFRPRAVASLKGENAMRRVINGLLRDAAKLPEMAEKSGDPNDCHSTYARLLYDERDGLWLAWRGHHWGGLGADTLKKVQDPIHWLEANRVEVDTEDFEAIKNIVDAARTP
jgi:hypothetical protein